RVFQAAQIAEDSTVRVKVRIQIAVGVITRQSEMDGRRVFAGSCDHDSSVGLDSKAISNVIAAAEIGDYSAYRSEGVARRAVSGAAVVEAAIGVVACQREIAGNAVENASRGHDLAIGLKRQAFDPGVAAPIGKDFASHSKGVTRRAVRGAAVVQAA